MELDRLLGEELVPVVRGERRVGLRAGEGQVARLAVLGGRAREHEANDAPGAPARVEEPASGLDVDREVAFGVPLRRLRARLRGQVQHGVRASHD